MIGAVLLAAFQGGLLVLPAGLADLVAASAARAPVRAVQYLTPDGDIDTLPKLGTSESRTNPGTTSS